MCVHVRAEGERQTDVCTQKKETEMWEDTDVLYRVAHHKDNTSRNSYSSSLKDHRHPASRRCLCKMFGYFKWRCFGFTLTNPRQQTVAAERASASRQVIDSLSHYTLLIVPYRLLLLLVIRLHTSKSGDMVAPLVHGRPLTRSTSTTIQWRTRVLDTASR